MRWRTANNHRRSKGGEFHGTTYGGTSVDEFMEEMWKKFRYGGTSVDEFMEEMWKKFRYRKDLVIVTYIPGEETDGQV